MPAAGLRPDVVQKWDAVIKEATKDPKFIEAAHKIGTIPMYVNSDEFKNASLGELEEAPGSTAARGKRSLENSGRMRQDK